VAQDPRLVELVARAICGVFGADPDELDQVDHTPYWQAFVEHAEAAIAAINRTMNP